MKNISITFTKNTKNVKNLRVQDYWNVTMNKRIKTQQQMIFYENKRNKKLLQKQNNRCIQFRDINRSYVELENGQKAREEIFKI